ncbi:Clavaminate synthase-like protein [Atractiella rhizophila]|nr:Clavaminate synthase-like protein [Atractiella rhizophila]
MSFSRGARALRPLSRAAVFRPKRNFVTAAPSSLVPVVDFGKFLNGNEAEKLESGAEVLDAFKNVGFVYLSNHGIPDSKLSKVFELSSKFFALPQELKDELAWDDPRSNRGYVTIGRERVTQATSAEEIAKLRASAPDVKETMEIGRDWEGQEEWPNKWPNENWASGQVSGFRNTMVDFYVTCHNLHLNVMSSLALGLGLPRDYFVQFCNKQTHNCRLLNYPATLKKVLQQGGGNRAGAHSDYGTVTLLFQDSIGGLEVQDKSGAFVPAPPIPGTVVINVGDLLARWSNDLLRSTLHRVVMPPSSLDKDGNYVTPRRQSIAFFSNPNMDADIECLPLKELGEPKYEKIKTIDYLVSRLSETYRM